MIPGTSGPSGFPCSICGGWMSYGQTHMCGGTPQFQQPGSLTIPPCRAPWNPLNADAVRLIIREELERYFAQQRQGNDHGN